MGRRLPLHSPPDFCLAASAVAQRANGFDSSALAAETPRLPGELQAALRYQPGRLALTAR